MRQKFKKPLFVFVFGVVIASVIFFLFPINLFDGEIVYEEGIRSWKEKANISLSYFIGIGAEKELIDQLGVKDFYLLPRGYVLACIVLIGIPGLLAYRVHIKNR